jgi:hypothetical protein
MSELLRFRSEGDSEILLEVADPAGGPVTRGRRPEERVIEATDSIEQVLRRLGPALRGMASQLREAADRPDEIEIEFAVKISADSNVIIARAGGEANYRVAVRWSRGSAA